MGTLGAGLILTNPEPVDLSAFTGASNAVARSQPTTDGSVSAGARRVEIKVITAGVGQTVLGEPIIIIETFAVEGYTDPQTKRFMRLPAIPYVVGTGGKLQLTVTV